ncbi:unknown [Alces alces papillomavirus 1]|uniref:Uncharacterized protein n=1 Tax=European elk papillomavirus TaxID=2885846 RepID=Q84258_PAPVE|nr:hypothetical protein EEPVgp05 [Alces alces papillomavirus 1]AAA66853.1 unknown [Alces alces papillomavirus 1]
MGCYHPLIIVSFITLKDACYLPKTRDVQSLEQLVHHGGHVAVTSRLVNGFQMSLPRPTATSRLYLTPGFRRTINFMITRCSHGVSPTCVKKPSPNHRISLWRRDSDSGKPRTKLLDL